MSRGIYVDSFAGGGGASDGMRRALGRSPDIAINHDPEAIAMHAANHPDCEHFAENVWRVDPRKATRGRKVLGAWFSPDCRHFSRAKGSKPVSPRVRGLAWVAVHWASTVQPDRIFLENVREFQDWGPLIPKLDARGRAIVDLHGNPVLIPDPTRKGQSFRRFVGRLRNLGYQVEWRDMNAADYGAPTNRKRLFLIARRDGKAISWPAPTHAPAAQPLLGLKPYRTAAECIDWTLPCPSIFARKKPLAENTMKRIANGLKRYVFESAQPFIVGVGGRMGCTPPAGVNQPSNTITSKNDRAVVVPYIARIGQTGGNGKNTNSVEEPVTTVMRKAEHLLLAPILSPQYGESGGAPVTEPSPTACASNHHMLVAPVLVGAGGSEYAGKPRPADVPLNTVKQDNHSALVSAFVVKHFGGQTGVPADQPLPTTTQRGTQNQIATACLVHMNHGEKQWSDPRDPLRTVVGGNHHAEVRAFLIKYYGTGCGQKLTEPLATTTVKDRFGLVMIKGEPYQIVDIGMRMLTPRELARAQGFEDSYKLTGTKTSQIAKIGNSVPPPIVEAIVRANCVEKRARARRRISAKSPTLFELEASRDEVEASA